MTIVLDFLIEFEDDIFTYTGTQRHIGVTWIPLLYELAKAEGIAVVLARQYLKEKRYSFEDLLISEGITHNTQLLLATPVKPFFLFSGESPNVDWKLYTFLRRYSKLFQYCSFFEGSRNSVHSIAKFQPFFWPNDHKRIMESGAFFSAEKTKKLVMVAANKKQNDTARDNVILRLIKSAGMKLMTKLLPSIRLLDLYSFRMEAIRFFASKEYFGLYGRHWENHRNLSTVEREAVRKLAPKAVTDKQSVLRSHQFALCFENCVYPGYITEKIFDCFFAGCIPVYLGAPDVEKYIPADLFIDMRLFKDFEALATYLEGLSTEKILDYLEKIAAYLKSGGFQLFTDHSFVQQIFARVKEEKKKNLKRTATADVDSTKIV